VQENWLSDSDTKIGKALGFVANVVTPTYPSEIKTTDVEAALQDVYRSGADVSDKKIFQTDAPKNITVDGKNVNLTAKQYEHFEKVRGDNTMEFQGALQNNPIFEGAGSALQSGAIDKMYDYIEQVSKSEMGLGYDPENWVSELQGSSPEEIADAVVQKAVESIAKSGAYSNKYEGFSQMLEDGSVDVDTVAALLPKKQKTGYFDFIQGSNIEMDDYLDVIEYYNGDGIKQEDVKAYIEKGFASDRDRCRVWQCFYSKNTIPDEWQ
jgi:hypothetical protein